MRGVSLTKESTAEKAGKFIVGQFKENRTRTLTIIGFVIGFILLGGFFYIRLQTLNDSASDRLAAAYQAFMFGDKSTGVKHLESAIVNTPNAPSAYQARLVSADMLIEQKDYDKAFVLIDETIRKAKPAAYRPIAVARMIFLFDQKQDYPNAIMYSNEFISKYASHYLIKDVYMGLARFYTITKSPEDAKRVYNEILLKFPATPEAQKAEKILQGMGA